MDRKEDSLHDLMGVLHKVYDHGIKVEKINIYDTEKVVEVPTCDVTYRIHVIPSLSEKPPPSDELPDLRSKPDEDPFAEPFAPAEFLTDLDEGYHSLLNKFCFLPEQFVLVSHRWAVQADPLEVEDLWAAWRVLKAMEKAGRRGFVFVNVGKLSGASQPHRHIQPPAQPHVLPLPYVHFFTPLPGTSKHHQPAPSTSTATSSSTPSLSSSTSSSSSSSPSSLSTPSDPTTTPSQEITPATLQEIYETHLGQFESHGAQPESEGVRSHNVLLTLRGLHTIPRKSRDVEVPVPAHLKNLLIKKAEEEKEKKQKEEGKDDDEDDEEIEIEDKLKFSINGLGFVGYFFMKPGCDRLLKEFGLDNVLKRVGYERKE
ncbi:HIT-like domain [Phaffia rhodozyma]|uniref:HIT-like domain n=1 Tax=Phaffia rhodozyma TaxID=264483 RepID=A0A0F7SGT9_PHARH|nr:HIT-like domain [Phaffia rhodozyma]